MIWTCQRYTQLLLLCKGRKKNVAKKEIGFLPRSLAGHPSRLVPVRQLQGQENRFECSLSFLLRESVFLCLLDLIDTGLENFSSECVLKTISVRDQLRMGKIRITLRGKGFVYMYMLVRLAFCYILF